MSNTNEWIRSKSNPGCRAAGKREVQPLGTKIFTASYPITCFACGRAIGTGSKFTYVPFGQRRGLVAVHLECACCEAK